MGSRRRGGELVLLEPNLVDLGGGRGTSRVQSSVLLYGRGGYTGARTDRAALQEWNPRLDSPDTATVPDLPKLRSRSRDVVRNQPLAAAGVSVVVASAVGAGLYPVPAPDADYLGITSEQAAVFAQQVMRIWWAHAGTPAIDIAGRAHHGVQQRTTLRAQIESGDVFALRRYDQRPGELLGLKIQLIEADRVSTPTGHQNDPNIVDGVELDRDGRPVALFVSDQHPGEFTLSRQAWARVPFYGQRTGTPQIIHIFDPLRPGQTRGVPLLAAALERLKQMDRAVNAELMAQVVSGMIVYSIKTRDGESVPRPVVQPVGEVERDEATGQVKIDYAAVVGLAEGEELVQHAPSRPGTTFEPFQLHVAREVGASVGVPAGILLHWFSKAYSASKGEVELFERHLKIRRDVIGYDFSGTVYAWLVEEAVARGLLDAPGFFSDPLARAAWLGCEWRGVSKLTLDPLKEVNAIEKRLELRVSTLAQEVADLSGADWRDTLQQAAIEKAEIGRLGLAAPAPTAALPAAPVEPDPDEEPEEGDEE